MIMITLAVHWITSLGFDTGFGGTHFAILFWCRTLVMGMAFVLALNILLGGMTVHIAIGVGK